MLDEGLSESFQDNVTSSICSQYATTKDPQGVISKISEQFPEVSTMKVHLCQTDKICFSLELQKPLFLLNDKFVVCDSDGMIPKDHFNFDVVTNLPRLNCSCDPNASAMRQFFEKLQESIQKDFEINWISGTEIILKEKNKPSVTFVCSEQHVPNQKDIEHCKSIYESLPVKNKKKNMSYDLRFKNQIIVR